MTVLRRSPRVWNVGRDDVQHLGKLRHDLAVVLDLPGRPDGALEREAAAWPRSHAELVAVPVLDLPAVVVRQRIEVLHQSKLGGIHVIETSESLTAVRQPLVGGDREAELCEVLRPDQYVVGDLEVAPDPPEVADVDGNAREDLVLDARHELIVVRAMAPAAQ